jgi:BirA family biotin operon repressor/biotin-[acetyl-CoA-carboxylase] ligase
MHGSAQRKIVELDHAPDILARLQFGFTAAQSPSRISVKMGELNRYNLAALRESIRPVRVRWMARCGSTNDVAARARRAGVLFAPVLVLTGAQVAGRGRGASAWWSGDGCITATLVVAAQQRFAPHQLPLLVGVALRRAVAKLARAEGIVLKWPNDLLHRGRKLAGVLCERVGGADLIGIGLNVNLDPRAAPRSLRSTVTSLSQITGRRFRKSAVLSDLVRQVHEILLRRDEFPFAQVLREYNQHDALRGRRVAVTVNGSAVRGTCAGLDASGQLLVRETGRRGAPPRRIVAGHVQVL